MWHVLRTLHRSGYDTMSLAGTKEDWWKETFIYSSWFLAGRILTCSVTLFLYASVVLLFVSCSLSAMSS